MTQRNATLQAAADTLRRIEDNPAQAVQYARALVIDLLSPQQKQVYEYVYMATEAVEPAEIRDKFGWSMNYASTLLKDLYEVGLLTREEKRDEIGRVYRYKVRE